MKQCPRCKRMKLADEQALNALSRRDNETYICSDCGTAEAMEDYAASRDARMACKLNARRKVFLCYSRDDPYTMPDDDNHPTLDYIGASEEGCRAYINGQRTDEDDYTVDELIEDGYYFIEEVDNVLVSKELGVI